MVVVEGVKKVKIGYGGLRVVSAASYVRFQWTEQRVWQIHLSRWAWKFQEEAIYISHTFFIEETATSVRGGRNLLHVDIYIFSTIGWRTAVVQWFGLCATNRKVAGSIPDGVIGIFHWYNPSDRTMAPGSTQPLTEMSIRSISWG